VLLNACYGLTMAILSDRSVPNAFVSHGKR
jgi:hypothetical protein